MQTFYSQEQYDEYERDLHGDGFSNEYQRCYFQSRLERPLKDERNEAVRLHAQGRYVVCAEWEVCCPTTDGLIGYDWLVLKDFATEAQAQEYIGVDPDDRPEGIFLFQPVTVEVEKLPEVPDFDDEIPF
jgi:hypothetical protein